MSNTRKRTINKQSKAVVGGRGLVRLSGQETTKTPTTQNLSPSPSVSVATAEMIQEDVQQLDFGDHYHFASDVAPEPTRYKVWPYVQLLEHYKSFLMDSNEQERSCTIHLINDFNTDDQGKIVSKPGYSAVFAFSVESKSGLAPVACCSICISKDLLSFFALKNHGDSTISESHIFNCRHTQVIAQRSLSENKFNCSIQNEKLVFQQLSTVWGRYSRNLTPGWYNFDASTHSKGRLGVYVTNNYSAFVFASELQRTGTTTHFCFLCKKRTCIHAELITHKLDAVVPDSVQTIRIPARPLDSLVSKAVYPCMFFC
jgi:hypothetical protein